MCPVLAQGLPQRLLDQSSPHGDKRYACHEGRAYCAQRTRPSRDTWHGYPVSWKEVPPAIVREWLKAGLISRRHLDT